MYNHYPPDILLLCTHVDDFLLAASSRVLAVRFYDHYRGHHKCEFGIAATFVGIDISRDRSTPRIYLSQTSLVDRLLEQEFAGIIRREKLTGNDLRYNPGNELNDQGLGHGMSPAT